MDEFLENSLHKTREFLEEIIDPDFGLIDKMRAKSVLNVREIEKIKAKDTRIGRNSQLLEIISNKKKISELCEALKDTGQQHIVNYLKACGERNPQFDEDWPLTQRELSILESNHEALVDILDTCDLIGRLYSDGVINRRHVEFISSRSTSYEKSEALLEILRRCSVRSYRQTIKCLRESNQSHIAEILETGGVLIPVHATLETDNLDETETQIANEFTNLLMQRNVSAEQAIRAFNAAQLNIIAVKRGQSIVIYICCSTEDELDRVCKMIDNSEMKTFLQHLFDLLTHNINFKVLSVNIYESDVNKAKQIFQRMKELKNKGTEGDSSFTSKEDSTLSSKYGTLKFTLGFKMNDVLLVLNMDSEDWPDYIKSLFKSTSGPEIQTEYDTVLSRTKTPKSQSKLTVVIASPGHLEFLRENVDFNYKAIVPNPENAVLFLLGIKKEDLGSRGTDRQPITGRFPDYATWKQFDHDHAPEMVRHIEQRLKALKSKRPIPSAPKGFQLVPEVVRSEDPTAIVIFFDDPLTTAAKVEVLLSDDDTGRHTIVIPAEWRNPYSFTIVAPEHQEGEVNFRVLVDGKLGGTRQLKYVSNFEKYSSLTQMYVHQLSSLCSLLTDRKISSSEIDNCLANIFDPESSADAAVPIEAFELLFGIYRYSANESSAVELPTMLHFAAKHGLKELTAKLTDLPDACLAHAIRNVDSKMPEDLARSHKHMSLSSFLENFTEVIDGFEDLYVKCRGYINADGPANQDLSKHLKANSRLLEPSGTADYIALYSSETPDAEDDDDDLYYMCVPSGVKTKATGEVKKTLASAPSSANQKLQPQRDLVAPSSAAKRSIPQHGWTKCPWTKCRGHVMTHGDKMSADKMSRFRVRVRGLPLSGDQQQLVDIMEMYKTKKCSMAEVESLFKQWKATSNVKSFRDKQEKLKKMKEYVVKAKAQENISTSQARQHKRDITPTLPPKAR